MTAPEETTWEQDIAEIARLLRDLDQKHFALEKALVRATRDVRYQVDVANKHEPEAE